MRTLEGCSRGVDIYIGHYIKSMGHTLNSRLSKYGQSFRI